MGRDNGPALQAGVASKAGQKSADSGVYQSLRLALAIESCNLLGMHKLLRRR